jgi:hypothetical protein
MLLAFAHGRGHQRLHDLVFEMLGRTRLKHLTLRVVFVDHTGVGSGEGGGPDDDRPEDALQI